MATPAVIVSVARTPIGRPGGIFRGLGAADLGGVAIGAALARGRLRADEIGAVYLAGSDIVPEAAAALGDAGLAGLPRHVAGLGLAPWIRAVVAIEGGAPSPILVAGMAATNGAVGPAVCPQSRPGADQGAWLHLASSGEADWVPARAAATRGDCSWEIVPVPVPGPPPTRIDQDELGDTPRCEGDGAVAMGLMAADGVRELGRYPLAAVAGYAVASSVGEAVGLLLEEIGWAPGQVDLWEIDEGRPPAADVCLPGIAIPAGRINVQGGAAGLGDPAGLGGIRRGVSLVGALRRQGGLRGVIAVAGADAAAVAIEMEGGVACGARRR
ncbi:MAG: hypothetical protein JNJ44_01840 [Zoogloeaceae bacterium]|nr:hypothetical protein [Zoogloeaceae bacterium]